jgi:2,4-dienoyl-CoA reductase-like NADH-dependent reductase (Old Yellow Enzyme family)
VDPPASVRSWSSDNISNLTDLGRFYHDEGAAVAKQLASRGVRVAINYSSNRERAAKTLSQLEGSGHILVQGNAFDREEIEQLVKVRRLCGKGMSPVLNSECPSRR